MSQLFTKPVEAVREPSDHLALLREAEEKRLLARADCVPLKARWRRSWRPDEIIGLAEKYSVGLDSVSSEPHSDERSAVNFLRHERTAYDRLVSFPVGLQHGIHGSYESVYLVIKQRVHEKISADFPWLEMESMIQLEEAAEAIASGRRSAYVGS